METESQIVSLGENLVLLPAGLTYREIRVGFTTADGNGVMFDSLKSQSGQTLAPVTAEIGGRQFKNMRQDYKATTEVADALLTRLAEINDQQDAGTLTADAADDAAGSILEQLKNQRIIAAKEFATNHPALFEGRDISNLAEVVINVDTRTE